MPNYGLYVSGNVKHPLLCIPFKRQRQKKTESRLSICRFTLQIPTTTWLGWGQPPGAGNFGFPTWVAETRVLELSPAVPKMYITRKLESEVDLGPKSRYCACSIPSVLLVPESSPSPLEITSYDNIALIILIVYLLPMIFVWTIFKNSSGHSQSKIAKHWPGWPFSKVPMTQSYDVLCG